MTPPPTEAELRAFVGVRAGHYLSVWQPSSNTGDVWRFHFPAATFGPLWAGYRKMYGVAFGVFAIPLIASVVDTVISVRLPRLEAASLTFASLVTLAVWFFLGIRGYAVYLSHVKRVIAQVRSLNLSADGHLSELAERGGANMSVPFVFVLVMPAIIFCVDATIAAMLGIEL